MELPSFSEYSAMLKEIEKAHEDNTECSLDGFLDCLEKRNLSLEMVMTGDIANVTLPIGMVNRMKPSVMTETPKNPDFEKFVLKHKLEFKKRYGDAWENVLYATANKLFGNKK